MMKKDTSKLTILLITLGFIVVYLLLNQQWAIYTALSIGLIGVLSNSISRKIEWLWFKLSFILSKIIPSVLLVIIFYVLLYPLSLISRVFIKDPLFLKNNHNSTFRNAPKGDIKQNMEKTW